MELQRNAEALVRMNLFEIGSALDGEMKTELPSIPLSAAVPLPLIDRAHGFIESFVVIDVFFGWST